MPEFKNKSNVDHWFSSQPLSKRFSFCARSALRALPAMITEERDLVLEHLPSVARALLIGSVAPIELTDETKRAAQALSLRASGLNGTLVASGLNAARCAFDLADFVSRPETNQSAELCFHYASGVLVNFEQNSVNPIGSEARETRNRIAYLAQSNDASLLDDCHTMDVFDHPLWLNNPPDDFSLALTDFLSFLKHDEKWGFWYDWYKGFLDGDPLNWDFQRKVAMIEDSIWEIGPEAVAKEIEKIRPKYDLIKRIEELERERDALKADSSRYGIGGNNPPEHLSVEPQIVKETMIIWDVLDELKVEIHKEHPNRARVQQLVETLGRALKAILVWCGRKGDLTVDQVIKWGVPIGGATILANPKLVTDLIEAAKVWLPFL